MITMQSRGLARKLASPLITLFWINIAAAQTVTSPALIPGTDPTAPRRLKLVSYAAKVAPKVKKNTLVFGPCTAVAPYVYSLTAACPAPLAPDPAPTATPFTLTDGDARYGAIWGFNRFGGIGTEEGSRVGLIAGGSELILVGAPIDAHGVAYTVDGTRRSHVSTWYNLTLTGIAGTWSTDGIWTGEADCIRERRAFTIAGTTAQVATTITNICPTPIEDVVVIVGQDPDDGDSGAAGITDNRIIARGVEAGLLGRSKARVYHLTTTDPRFVAAILPLVIGKSYSFQDPDLPALTSQKGGYASKADRLIFLTGKVGTINPGDSVTVTFEMGVK